MLMTRNISNFGSVLPNRTVIISRSTNWTNDGPRCWPINFTLIIRMYLMVKNSFGVCTAIH